MKQIRFKDIKVSTHSFIGAAGDGWIHEPIDHGAKKGVLEIKCLFSINNCLVHCMAPKQGKFREKWVSCSVTGVTLSFGQKVAYLWRKSSLMTTYGRTHVGKFNNVL